MSNKAIMHGAPVIIPDDYGTLAEMITHIAKKHPDKGLRFINLTGPEEFVSYPELVDNARTYLYKLYENGVKPGDICILEIDSSKEFYYTFWACILGGIIAAPVSEPKSLEPNSAGLFKLTQIWKVLNKPCVIIEEAHRKHYEKIQSSEGYENFKFLTTGDLSSDVRAEIYPSKPDDLIFLQFSSGSTGNPKGVRLTSRKILSNAISSTHKIQSCPSDVVFTWLPHTHDMGLFGQHISPIVNGNNIMVFSPYSFIRSPFHFLAKITEYHGSWFCCTNFGLDWITKKISDQKLQLLDLSSLRFILVGAEPISTSVVQSFTKKFLKCGFCENKILAAYGMAEATLAICLTDIGEKPRCENISRSEMLLGSAVKCEEGKQNDTVTFIHEGSPAEGIGVRIADQDGNTLDENKIGEIQIQGASVTDGYYNCDEISKNMFTDGWMHTGDLGFISDKSLVVSGRIKDIIFVRGQNYYAHDLEESVYQDGSIPRGYLAFAGLFNSTTEQEELLAFVKYKQSTEKFLEIRQKIIDLIHNEFGLETTHVIPVNTIPKTTSGKTQRFYLQKWYENGDYNEILKEISSCLKDRQISDKIINPPENELEAFLCQCWSRLLNIPEKDVSIDDPFTTLGGNSIKAFQLHGELEQYFGRELSTDVLVLCRTIREISAYLSNVPKCKKTTTPVHLNRNGNHIAVAVTGLSLRLPYAKNQSEFWKNLISKRNCIQRVSERRKELSGCADWDDWLGELSDIDCFDNEFFEIASQDAQFMDPVQRLILETSYEALEDAGLNPGIEDERNVGVYTSGNGNLYFEILLDYLRDHPSCEIPPKALVGNMNSIASALIAHKYNFTGPCIAVDTACSSFMTTLQLAAEEIRRGGICSAVIASANVLPTSTEHRLAHSAGIVSTKGVTRAFDRDSDGSVIGEGVVAVCLETLETAEAAGKNIYGIIRGTAINNDGYSLGIMAPNPKGQYEVLLNAYRDAGIAPDQIDYIEAHGTGTVIGDPVELSALTKLFSENQNDKLKKTGIGSVKTNVGHLLPTAGGAGLAKVLLCMKHKKLVPSLNMEHPNPDLELEKTPFYVVTETCDWKTKNNETRKAGISSFGLGGTNAHVVVEEYPEKAVECDWNKPHLLTLSAKTPKALNRIIAQITEVLNSDSSLSVNNLCFTRNRYRTHYCCRAACVISEKNRQTALNGLIQNNYKNFRPAKICLAIGDLKRQPLFSGKSSSECGGLPDLLQICGIDQSDVVNDCDRKILLSFTFCYLAAKKLTEYCKNLIKIEGIGSGIILKQLLLGEADLQNALRLFLDYTGKESDHDGGSALSDIKTDILLSLGMEKPGCEACLSSNTVKKPKLLNFPMNSDCLPEFVILPLLAELYINGVEFNWEKICPDHSGKIVSLPPYPFEKTSLWLKTSKGD